MRPTAPSGLRLGIVSAKYPFGAQEPYLDTELRALAGDLGAITIVPASPPRAAYGFANVPGEVVALPLAGARTFALAARAFARRPLRAFATLGALLFDRYPLRVKVKNLAVVPKGFALAQFARARGIEHLHAYWLSTPATVAWIASRMSGIPFSATAHRWDIYEDNLTARKLRDARFVRAISERGRRDLLARTGGDPAKVVVVRLGAVLPQRGVARQRAGALRVLCAAAMVPVKGHAVLLEALDQLRANGVEFICTLAGDGPLRPELERDVARRGLRDQVIFAGRIPHDDLLASLQGGDYDVAVLASIERPGGLMEGVPVALIEAMAAGVVVVASDSGSVRELVDETAGLLVPQSDSAALASALTRIARDSPLLARLRQGAWDRVEREFDIAKTAQTFVRRLTALQTP